MTTTNTAALISQYLDGRLARGEITERTHQLLAARLVSLERACPGPVESLDRTALLQWAASLTLSPASRRGYVSCVKVFCRWLVLEGYLEVDPGVHLATVREPRRVPRALSAAEVRRLLDVVADDRRGTVIVLLMVGCGLRCAEVSGLELADYDDGTEVLRVKGKGGHERVVPVPPEVSEALGAYIDERGFLGSETALICAQGRPGTGISPAHVVRLVSRWLRLAGVKRAPGDGRSAHALRHTAASDVYERSKDLRATQEMLGHQNLATTAIYLRRANLDRLREAMGGRRYAAPQAPAG